MKTKTLSDAMALSDRDLLTRIDALAATEREATGELVAHLAALELRPTLYLARGYGSLFDYCTQALRMSGHRVQSHPDHAGVPALPYDPGSARRGLGHVELDPHAGAASDGGEP
jgi:hypothetical protein